MEQPEPRHEPASQQASVPGETAPWTRPRVLAIAGGVVLLIGLYVVFGGGGVRASHLDLLPSNSPLVLVVDVARIHDSDLGEVVRDAFAGPYGELTEEMRRDVGFGPDRVSHLVIGGDPAARMPCFVVVLKDSLDDEEMKRVVRAARVRPEPREIDGRTMWGEEDDRMAVARVRPDTILFGMPRDVEAALRGGGKRGRAAELLVDAGGLDASLAMVFDWSAAGPMRRGMERAFRDAAPLLFKHAGPIVAVAEVGDDVSARVKLMDSRGEREHASYTVEVDGAFLEELLTDLGRLAPEPRRRRAWEEEPEPAQWEPTAEPEPATARSAEPAPPPRIEPTPGDDR